MRMREWQRATLEKLRSYGTDGQSVRRLWNEVVEIQRSNPLLGIIAMMNGNDHKYPTVECVLRELDRHEGAPEDCGLLLDGDESERSKHEAPRERGRRR